ncbi:unnamed protein product [Thlaspi arvense]|uniref:Uncharacterized protein n=1 Tax=Thlaspi arvense TaxID=13288 RepID=A0AAU9STS4_THLAR|nr:unnamed protein product [Thlaspi arvense]
MAGFPPDKPFKPVEEEDRAEKSVPAITTEEEVVEEERTEEDEHKEEAFGSSLDSDPNNSVPNRSIEDNESDEENENPQQDSITSTRIRGSTSSTTDQNLRLVHRSGAQMSEVMMPPEENDGSTDSLIPQPLPPNPSVDQNRWSDRGSTSFKNEQNQSLHLPNRYGPLEENLGFGGSVSAQPPYQNQIRGRDQTMNQPQRFKVPNRGSVQNDSNQSFGVVQQLQQQRHNAAGFDPNGAPWEPQITRPLMPNQNTFRGPARVDRSYATWIRGQIINQQQRMVMREMQDQNHFNQTFGMQQQVQIGPSVVPVQAPMRPMMHNQDQVVPYLVPGQAPMRPMMYNQGQGQIVPYVYMTMMQQDHVVPYLVPCQAPMRPVMYSQEQDQNVPNGVPFQALMRPMMYNQGQGQIVPYVYPRLNQMRPRMQQGHVVPFLVRGQAPVRPMMYNQEQDQIVPNGVPFQAPMMYNQEQVVPFLSPAQAPSRPMMFNQQQQINQGQHFGFPIEINYHQAFPNTAAASRPALNRPQMQQLQPQTQQPMQSHGFNAGPSSGQSQD